MEVIVVMEYGVFDEDVMEEIREGARSEKLGFITVDDAKDFLSKGTSCGDLSRCVIPYGSVTYIQELSKHNVNGLWLNEDKLSWGWLTTHWNQYLLNSNSIATDVASLRVKTDKFYDLFGKNDIIFIKPYRDAKAFSGMILHRIASRDTLSQLLNVRENVTDQTFIVVAEPLVMINEWRFFIMGRKVIGASQYNQNREKAYIEGCDNKQVTETVDRILRDPVEPDFAYTLDMGQTETGDVGLIEVGSMNCCDLYAVNKKQFFANIQGIMDSDCAKRATRILYIG